MREEAAESEQPDKVSRVNVNLQQDLEDN